MDELDLHRAVERLGGGVVEPRGRPGPSTAPPVAAAGDSVATVVEVATVVGPVALVRPGGG